MLHPNKGPWGDGDPESLEQMLTKLHQIYQALDRGADNNPHPDLSPFHIPPLLLEIIPKSLELLKLETSTSFTEAQRKQLEADCAILREFFESTNAEMDNHDTELKILLRSNDLLTYAASLTRVLSYYNYKTHLNKQQTNTTSSSFSYAPRDQYGFELAICNNLDTKTLIDESRAALTDGSICPRWNPNDSDTPALLLNPLLIEHMTESFDPQQRQRHLITDSIKDYLTLEQALLPQYHHQATKAAECLKANLPLSPQAIITTAVHESEVNLPRFLDELSKQDYDFKDSPVWLFVNGKDPEKIKARLEEIDLFKRKHGKKIDLRVIAAQINQWQFGLKFFPAAVATHAFEIAGIDDRCHDIPWISLDTDITKISDPHFINNLVTAHRNGYVLQGVEYQEYAADLELLYQINPTFMIVIELLKTLDHYLRANLSESPQTNDPSKQPVNIHACGLATVISLEVMLKLFGIPAHMTSINTYQSQIVQTFSTFCCKLKNMQDVVDKKIFKAHPTRIETDLGHILRALTLGRPIEDMWTSHDGLTGTWSILDPSKRTINFKIIGERVEAIIQQYSRLFSQDEITTEVAKLSTSLRNTFMNAVRFCTQRGSSKEPGEQAVHELLLKHMHSQEEAKA